MLLVVQVAAYAPIAGLTLHQAPEEAWTAVLQPIAYAEDITDLYKAQPMIEQLPRAVEQRSELTDDCSLLPHQQQSALPKVRR